MRKTRIFLYAYVNHVGAFNLSARTLCTHLDKTRFQVFALSLGSGNLDNIKLKGVKLFNCFFPAKISNYLGILWGVYHADVVFVMRGNHFRFVRFCIRVLSKRSFKRQGNKIDDQVLGAISSAVGGKEHIADSYNFCDRIYAPTIAIGKYNLERWGVKFDPNKTLPPFINTEGFNWSTKERHSVQNIVFIGNDMIRKNIENYLLLAAKLPQLVFYVVGRAPRNDFFEKATNNLIYVGSKTPEELNDFLDDMDLHCFTSRSEGFGKVTIEVAAKGIPSILYDDYGAEEWLNNYEEGIIVRNEEDYLQELIELIENPMKYRVLLEGLPQLLERFSMKNQLRSYEEVIEEVYAS